MELTAWQSSFDDLGRHLSATTFVVLDLETTGGSPGGNLGNLDGAANQASLNLIIVAFLVHLLGLVAERWLFFAESNHPQNLYYQRIA